MSKTEPKDLYNSQTSADIVAANLHTLSVHHPRCLDKHAG